jgi:RNA polymerase sigma-70 factor (ECF subfamily)
MDNINMEAIQMSVRDAVTRLKQGNIAALEILVEHYQKTAVEIAAYTTKDRAMAEDVVSECFLIVYDRIETFDSDRQFAPWFYRIVINQALKAIYKQSQSLSLEDLTNTNTWLENLPYPEVGNSPDPLEIETYKNEVRAALEELTPKQRGVIVLRYYSGLSETEIAEKLAIPRGTVKSRTFSATARLRKLISIQRLKKDDLAKPGGIRKREKS